MKILRFLILSFVLFILPFRTSAHEVRPAYLQIVQVDERTYEVFWKVPSMGDAVPRIQPQFPDDFEIEIVKPPRQVPGSVIYTYRIHSDAALQGQRISISGLNKTLIDVLVNVSYLNGEKATLMLQPDRDSSILPGKTQKSEVIKTYTVLGIEHIWFGIDHLLFVLALIIITHGAWKIIKTITAFTLAHSITLSLAVLGIVNFPTPPVEAVIALSIVFLAVEIVHGLDGRFGLASQKPWLVAFVFGLLHGFGFAGALSDVGLPQNEIPLALAFFNIGVEIGQIAFVVVVLAVLKLLSLKKDWPPITKKVPAYAIGTLAVFWMIERIAGFWG